MACGSSRVRKVSHFCGPLMYGVFGSVTQSVYYEKAPLIGISMLAPMPGLTVPLFASSLPP